MSTKTIPGPWTARKDEPEDCWLFITAPDPDDPSREVVIADTVYEDVAPLIVAAPALAATLRLLVEDGPAGTVIDMFGHGACIYCRRRSVDDVDQIIHKDDCPIVVGRALLKEVEAQP